MGVLQMHFISCYHLELAVSGNIENETGLVRGSFLHLEKPLLMYYNNSDNDTTDNRNGNDIDITTNNNNGNDKGISNNISYRCISTRCEHMKPGTIGGHVKHRKKR